MEIWNDFETMKTFRDLSLCGLNLCRGTTTNFSKTSRTANPHLCKPNQNLTHNFQSDITFKKIQISIAWRTQNLKHGKSGTYDKLQDNAKWRCKHEWTYQRFKFKNYKIIKQCLNFFKTNYSKSIERVLNFHNWKLIKLP